MTSDQALTNSELARSMRKLAALKAAVKDVRLSREGRSIVARALAKQEAVVRYRQNLPTR